MAYYKCPRCHSKDIYWGTEDRPTTYTHRVTQDGKVRDYHSTEWNEESVAFCRGCMVKAERILDQADLDRAAKIWKGVKIFVVVWIGGIAFIFLISTILSLL